MPRMMISRSSLLLSFVLLGPVAAAQGSASSHTVKGGDTLWAIARTYLGDPFLWPQIYKLNTGAIEDPHWIYPGQVLQLVAAPGQTAVPTQDTPAPSPAAPVRAEPVADAAPVRAPAPAQPAVAMDLRPVQAGQAEEPGMELFRRRRVANVRNAFRTYREVKFHPLRPGEFFSGGFLTEGNSFPFGVLLGPITPEQIESTRAQAAVQIYSRVAARAPAGAGYAVGDTLVVVDRRDGPVGYGEIVSPMGLIRVTELNGDQAVGEVIAVYGPMRDGQSVLVAEKFSDPGAAEYQAVSTVVEGHVLVARDHRELRLPQQVLFLDIGSRDGVALGDLFEARRTPGPQRGAVADAVDDLMATLQVVHVGEHTATVKIRNVIAPDIPPGTRVRLVAKLPS